MGISRVASEIQIYSAVYSSVVDRDACVRCACVCVCVCVCGRAHTIAFAWPVVHPAGHGLPRAARGNHICSVTKLRISHTGLIAAAAVTYLTFGQVARVELKCAPQTVFGISVVMLPRGYVYEVVAVARRITAEFILFNSLSIYM